MAKKQRAKVTFESEDGPVTVALSGRKLWAFRELHSAVLKGITSLENPAPRLSGYIHGLRGDGFNIETVREPHGGPYAGQHGRYFLRSRILAVVTE